MRNRSLLGEVKAQKRKRTDSGLPAQLMRAVMKLREAANYLKVHKMTLYPMIKRGDIPAFRVGRDWHLRRSDVEAWIASRISARRRGSSQVRKRAERLAFLDDSITPEHRCEKMQHSANVGHEPKEAEKQSPPLGAAES